MRVLRPRRFEPTILYSLMEQQLKGSDAKVEEGDVHMVFEDWGYNWLSRYSSKKPKEIHISWGILGRSRRSPTTSPCRLSSFTPLC